MVEGVEQYFSFVYFWVVDDYCFVIIDVEVGQCIFVGYCLVQLQYVGQCFVGVGIWMYVYVVQGWVQGGVVDGDDCLQVGIVVVVEYYLFVVGGGEGFEQYGVFDGVNSGELQ